MTLIYSKTLLSGVTANGPSASEQVTGSDIRVHLAVSAVGGNGAVVDVETSMDGTNWVSRLSFSTSLDSYSENTSAVIPVMRHVRVNKTAGTSAATATVSVFE